MEPRNHWKRYTKLERQRILAMLETYPTATVAKKFGRTPEAVRKQANLRGFRLTTHNIRHAGMSADDVADALGIHRETIKAWERAGLRVHRRGTTRLYQSIDPDDLTDWLKAGNVYRTAINPAGWEWQEIIQEIRNELRWLTLKDVAALVGVSHKALYESRCPPVSIWPKTPILVSIHCPSHYAPADVLAWLDRNPKRQTSAAARWMEQERNR